MCCIVWHLLCAALFGMKGQFCFLDANEDVVQFKWQCSQRSLQLPYAQDFPCIIPKTANHQNQPVERPMSFQAVFVTPVHYWLEMWVVNQF